MRAFIYIYSLYLTALHVLWRGMLSSSGTHYAIAGDPKESFLTPLNKQRKNNLKNTSSGELSRNETIKSLLNIMEREIKLNYSIEYSSESDDYTEFYRFDLINDLIIFSFGKAKIFELHLKKCPVCNMFFVPASRSDEIYCDRIIDGKTCKKRVIIIN